jgi:serine/threonine-protein kinase
MLRQDVERYLAGFPVSAHRGSRRYRVEKFIRRHRIEATAAIIVLATLVTGLSIAVGEGRRATRERDRAEQALAQSESVTNFMMELFRTGDADRETPPAQLSALDLIERGIQRANELSDQPVVQARLLDVVGQMSLHLGRFDDARRLLEQAIDIRRAAPGPRSLDLAASLIHLSWVHRRFNDFDRARALVSEALQIRQSALGPTHPDVADALYELGWLAFGPEQETIYRRALSILPDTGLAAERRVALLQAISTNLRRQARYEEAVTAGREALRVSERAFGLNHATTGYAMIHLADHIHDIVQDVDEAERLYRRGLELMEQQFGENSTRLIHGLHSLGDLLAKRGDNEAERLFRRSLAIRQSATGPEHPQVADELHLLAVELARQQRLKEAEALARRALHLSSQTLGPRHAVVTNARLPLLAEVLNQQGRQREANEIYGSALELTEAGGTTLGQLRRAYGLLLLKQGQYARAEEQLLQALALLESGYGDADHPNVQETKRGLMELYRQWGKPDLVERYRVPPGRFIPH